MIGVTRIRWPAILLAVAVALTTTVGTTDIAFAGPGPPSARTATAACPSVIFIGAAGSGELEHDPAAYEFMGPEIDKMADVVLSALAPHNLSLTKLADRYPADSVSDLDPFSHLGSLSLKDSWAARIVKYVASIDTGIANAESEAKTEIKKCPSTQLILAGYSQGAIVMHQVELKLAKNESVMSHIAGTLLLGDGDRAPNSRATLFGATAPDESTSALRADEGIRPYFKHPGPHDIPLPATTAEICSADDIVCDFKIAHDDTPSRLKKAVKVHTGYAIKDKHGHVTSYSPLLTSAANWLAAKIIAADVPAPPPLPPPPPPPTPPPPSVPPTGPTLIYDGNTALPPEAESPEFTGDRSFYGWSAATGELAEVDETLPSAITSDRCVVLLTNESLEPTDESELTTYLQQGGTILALGEHEGGNYNLANETLSRFAQSLGVGLSLVDGFHDYGPNVTYDIDPSPLTENVFVLGDNWASTVEVSYPAELLANTADGEGALIGAQSLGGGRFVMTGDSNLFSDENQGVYEDDDNGQLAHDLCP